MQWLKKVVIFLCAVTIAKSQQTVSRRQSAEPRRLDVGFVNIVTTGSISNKAPQGEINQGNAGLKAGESTSSSDPTADKNTNNSTNPEICECKKSKEDFVLCTGRACTRLPTNLFVPDGRLRIMRTNITALTSDMFANLSNLVHLDVRSNPQLAEIQPGSFANLQSLTNLTLSFNKFAKLSPESFKGLVNLQEVFLVQNGIKSLKDVAAALRPAILPNLYHVHLGGNDFGNILEGDLAPMEGSPIKDIQLMSSNIKSIQANVLRPLQQLGRLRLRENNISASNLVNFVKSLPRSTYALDVSACGLTSEDLAALFSALSGTSVAELWLVKNSFPVVKKGMITGWPGLKKLNMRELGENKFKSMQRLEKLRFRGNNLGHVEKDTFTGLESLVSLDLESCMISTMGPEPFSHLKSLETLFLQRNNLTSVFDPSNPPQTGIFKGLTSLKTLRADNARIEAIHRKSFSSSDTPNLQAINLEGNRIVSFSGGEFTDLRDLQILALSNNRITGWNSPIFGAKAPKTLNLRNNKITVPTQAMLRDFAAVQSFNLRANPLNCDCELLPFLGWVRAEPRYAKLKLDCGQPQEWRAKSVWDFHAASGKCDKANETGSKDRKFKTRAGFGKSSANSIPQASLFLTSVFLLFVLF
ncbi:unnamed protein product [Notodromas monacha]|uniref:LRRCT domain-containing protein n=1 Tax=Notodromas monacha TaxID=399045 RepID=A0A7R9C0L5_9CRUS|nr:unnamed protein product [Notodromas monacha]CAG0923948.1 unnamed protein product [Notodromas monacha]